MTREGGYGREGGGRYGREGEGRNEIKGAGQGKQLYAITDMALN